MLLAITCHRVLVVQIFRLSTVGSTAERIGNKLPDDAVSALSLLHVYYYYYYYNNHRTTVYIKCIQQGKNNANTNTTMN